MPYTTTGIHLTGLSPESTFTFVATWYIQLCPLPWSGLSTMVQPSPAYDPRVYEIYTRVMRSVPLATYKDDNDFGTWFRKVLGLVKNLAGPVAGTLLPGSGPAIQAAVNAITDAAKRRRQPAQPQRLTGVKPGGIAAALAADRIIASKAAQRLR